MTAPSVKVRLRLLWQAVKAARGKTDDAELRRQFLDRATKSGLVAALGRHGKEDVDHVIRWGLLDRDPWPAGEFDG
jgi:hypothetical protein